MKKLYSNLDSIRISNIYIRYAENLQERAPLPLGRAVMLEIESDLLQEVILTNTGLLEQMNFPSSSNTK
jgi:hypothetical protein